PRELHPARVGGLLVDPQLDPGGAPSGELVLEVLPQVRGRAARQHAQAHVDRPQATASPRRLVEGDLDEPLDHARLVHGSSSCCCCSPPSSCTTAAASSTSASIPSRTAGSSPAPGVRRAPSMPTNAPSGSARPRLWAS